MTLDQCIIRKCEESWDEEFVAEIKNKNNCSGFVKSVARKINVSLPPTQADGIMNALAKTWTKVSTGTEAATKAATGFFVLAGLKSGDHARNVSQGHIVIVVGGPLYRNKYPMCWGGSTGTAQSRGNKSVGEVWSTADRDHVTYYVTKNFSCTA